MWPNQDARGMGIDQARPLLGIAMKMQLLDDDGSTHTDGFRQRWQQHQRSFI